MPVYRHGAPTSSVESVAGRAWTVAFTPAPGFSRAFPWLAPVTLIAGTLLSLAGFGVSLVQLRAWAQVRASEDALRRSESRLRELVVLERDARDEAQAANRAKDEFLATLSHELRTPLNAMLGWLSMLRSGKMAPDRRDNALEVVERNAHTQARLIEDLLDVSRIMTGKVRLDLHPLQLGPIANTVVEALRPSSDTKGVRLHTFIAAGIPNLMGDAARLQQIVRNLLSNAIKFTPPGGDVHLDLQAAPPYVELRVRDRGSALRQSSCRRCSSGSGRPTARRHACRAAWASGWRSSAISWNSTAGRSRRTATAAIVAPCSLPAFPPRHLEAPPVPRCPGSSTAPHSRVFGCSSLMTMRTRESCLRRRCRPLAPPCCLRNQRMKPWISFAGAGRTSSSATSECRRSTAMH